jgi:undecaprenyl-diphosphatase
MSKAFHYIQRGDIAVFYMINHRVKCRLLDFLMPTITHLGCAAFTIGLAVAALILGIGSEQNIGWNISMSLAFSHLLIHVIKKIVHRPRPNTALSQVNTFCISLYDYSFPSGHTTAAFSVAASIAAVFPEMGLYVMTLAGCVGISRVYLGVHYPTDIIIGALIGTFAAYYINWFISII